MIMQINGRQFESRPILIGGYKTDAEFRLEARQVEYFTDGKPVSREEYERELAVERARGNLTT